MEILALVYGDDGFRCEYEVMEDAGTFKKGQRARSNPLIKNLEEAILLYTGDRKRFRCNFHFDKEGNICTVGLEIIEAREAK